MEMIASSCEADTGLVERELEITAEISSRHVRAKVAGSASKNLTIWERSVGKKRSKKVEVAVGCLRSFRRIWRVGRVMVLRMEWEIPPVIARVIRLRSW